jgi:hypothetical protein
VSCYRGCFDLLKECFVIRLSRSGHKSAPEKRRLIVAGAAVRLAIRPLAALNEESEVRRVFRWHFMIAACDPRAEPNDRKRERYPVCR